MASAKLQRTTLAEQVAQAIIDHIEENRLNPGDPLPSTAALASDYGVSRPIIREALKTLEGREIIEISNGRNPIVKPISSHSLRQFFERAIAIQPQSLIELLEVRRGLEIQSALLAARSHSNEDAEALHNILAQMREHLHDSAEYAELDVKLHLLIASASGNSLIFYLIESIRDALKDTIREGLRTRLTDDQLRRVQELHEDLITQITARNADGAAQAMAYHFDDAIDAVYRAMIQS